ncbi:MAG: 5-methyltetrahydropteroyltriglutamate--homocysteine S-methyltransferase, partial [Candidatus Neomarinimicrobiota bacterium]
MTAFKTQTLGYPHIGRDREMKRALEGYWKGRLDDEKLLETLQQVEQDAWTAQGGAGIDYVGVGDATLYDPVLDWAVRFGLVAERFRGLEGLDLTFTMARGKPGIPALELTKWFDTNYHYLVPEVDTDARPEAHFGGYLDTIRRAQAALGDRAVPIVLGPLTLLRLSRLQGSFDDVLAALLPLYNGLLEQLKALGVAEVQLHEPALILADAQEHKERYISAYAALSRPGLPINLVTFFDDLGDAFPWVTALPVATISLDFTRGDTAGLAKAHGWPEGKTLGAGVIAGRSVWQVRPRETLELIQALPADVSLRLGTSCSLQFVPYQAARETGLPKELRDVLAFAQEKLEELRLLARAATGDDGAEIAIQANETAWERFRSFAPSEPEVGRRIEALMPNDFEREIPYSDRREKQIQLPPLPTTTIGSFPQTKEVRRLRRRFKRGEITPEAYEAGIDAWIGYTIGAQ